jgi:hypothetical protein
VRSTIPLRLVALLLVRTTMLNSLLTGKYLSAGSSCRWWNRPELHEYHRNVASPYCCCCSGVESSSSTYTYVRDRFRLRHSTHGHCDIMMTNRIFHGAAHFWATYFLKSENVGNLKDCFLPRGFVFRNLVDFLNVWMVSRKSITPPVLDLVAIHHKGTTESQDAFWEF